MRIRLLSAGAVAAVLIAGCGGSSKPAASTPKKHATSTTTVSEPVSVTKAAPVTTTSSGSSSTSSGTPSFASASNCTALSGVGEQFAKAMESATSGGKFNLNQVVKAYQDLANAAPSAIKPDIQELASAFTEYASALNKVGYKFGSVPSASQVSGLEAASKDLSASKMESAAKAVEAWAVKNCRA